MSYGKGPKGIKATNEKEPKSLSRLYRPHDTMECNQNKLILNKNIKLSEPKAETPHADNDGNLNTPFEVSIKNKNKNKNKDKNKNKNYKNNETQPGGDGLTPSETFDALTSASVLKHYAKNRGSKQDRRDYEDNVGQNYHKLLSVSRADVRLLQDCTDDHNWIFAIESFNSWASFLDDPFLEVFSFKRQKTCLAQNYKGFCHRDLRNISCDEKYAVCRVVNFHCLEGQHAKWAIIGVIRGALRPFHMFPLIHISSRGVVPLATWHYWRSINAIIGCDEEPDDENGSGEPCFPDESGFPFTRPFTEIEQQLRSARYLNYEADNDFRPASPPVVFVSESGSTIRYADYLGSLDREDSDSLPDDLSNSSGYCYLRMVTKREYNPLLSCGQWPTLNKLFRSEAFRFLLSSGHIRRKMSLTRVSDDQFHVLQNIDMVSTFCITIDVRKLVKCVCLGGCYEEYTSDFWRLAKFGGRVTAAATPQSPIEVVEPVGPQPEFSNAVSDITNSAVSSARVVWCRLVAATTSAADVVRGVTTGRAHEAVVGGALFDRYQDGYCWTLMFETFTFDDILAIGKWPTWRDIKDSRLFASACIENTFANAFDIHCAGHMFHVTNRPDARNFSLTQMGTIIKLCDGTVFEIPDHCQVGGELSSDDDAVTNIYDTLATRFGWGFMWVCICISGIILTSKAGGIFDIYQYWVLSQTLERIAIVETWGGIWIACLVVYGFCEHAYRQIRVIESIGILDSIHLGGLLYTIYENRSGPFISSVACYEIGFTLSSTLVTIFSDYMRREKNFHWLTYIPGLCYLRLTGGVFLGFYPTWAAVCAALEKQDEGEWQELGFSKHMVWHVHTFKGDLNYTSITKLHTYKDPFIQSSYVGGKTIASSTLGLLIVSFYCGLFLKDLSTRPVQPPTMFRKWLARLEGLCYLGDHDTPWLGFYPTVRQLYYANPNFAFHRLVETQIDTLHLGKECRDIKDVFMYVMENSHKRVGANHRTKISFVKVLPFLVGVFSLLVTFFALGTLYTWEKVNTDGTGYCYLDALRLRTSFFHGQWPRAYTVSPFVRCDRSYDITNLTGVFHIQVPGLLDCDDVRGLFDANPTWLVGGVLDGIDRTFLAKMTADMPLSALFLERDPEALYRCFQVACFSLYFLLHYLSPTLFYLSFYLGCLQIIFKNTSFFAQFVLNALGTTGDHFPLQQKMKWLLARGFGCEYKALAPLEVGEEMLDNVESGEALKNLPIIANCWEEAQQDIDNKIHYMPLGGMQREGKVVAYELGVPCYMREGWQILPSTTALGIAINNSMDAYSMTEGANALVLGPYDFACPRTPRESVKFAGPKLPLLIHFGSAKAFSPDEIVTQLQKHNVSYPSNLIHCSNAQICSVLGFTFRHETNHDQFFKEYALIMCHGGSGTLITGWSAGACVISMSDWIDRRVYQEIKLVFGKSQWVFMGPALTQCGFTEGVHIFLRHITETILFTPKDPRAIVAEILTMCDNIMIFITANFWENCKIGLLFYFFGVLPIGQRILASRFEKDARTMYFIFSLFFTFFSLLLKKVPPDFRLYLCFCSALKFTWYFRTFWTFDNLLFTCLNGPAPGLCLWLFRRIKHEAFRKNFPRMLRLFALPFKFFHETEDMIFLRLSNTSAAWFLPAWHYDLIGNGEVLGIERVGKRRYTLLKPTSHNKGISRVISIPTGIPSRYMSQLHAYMDVYDDSNYNMFAQCQTAVIGTLSAWCYEHMHELTWGYIALTGICLVVAILGLLLGFALLITITVAFCFVLGLCLVMGEPLLEPLCFWLKVFYSFGNDNDVYEEASSLQTRIRTILKACDDRFADWVRSYFGPSPQKGSTPARAEFVVPEEVKRTQNVEGLILVTTKAVLSADVANAYEIVVKSGIWQETNLADYFAHGLCLYDLGLSETMLRTISETRVCNGMTWCSSDGRIVGKTEVLGCGLDTSELIMIGRPICVDTIPEGLTTIWRDNEQCDVTGLSSLKMFTSPLSFTPLPRLSMKGANFYAQGEKISDLSFLRLFGSSPSFTLKALITDARYKTHALSLRLKLLQETMMGIGSESHAFMNQGYKLLVKVIAPFISKAERFKVAWAPLVREINRIPAPQAGLIMAAHPTFEESNFDDTLAYHVRLINRYERQGYLRRKRLGVDSELRLLDRVERKIKHRSSGPNYSEITGAVALHSGMDGQAFACREVMMASLAPYSQDRSIVKVLPSRIEELARAICETSPDRYYNMRLFDPSFAMREFLKKKQYSAGLDFESCGLRKRGQIRRYGYDKVLLKAGCAPFETGVWRPALMHAFPKTQIVSRAKLEENPAKMRSITATIGANNIAQAVLCGDANKRHDFSGLNKTGMPTNGTCMQVTFRELAKYKYLYSLDATAFDRHIPNDLFKVVLRVRQMGFENHPDRDVIFRHLACAVEQTQRAYIANLVSDDLDSIRQSLSLEDRRSFDKVPDAKWEEIRSLAKQVAQVNTRFPGSILVKRSGGGTGDYNVTFQNSTACEASAMDSLCAIHRISPKDFTKHFGFINLSDDNILGSNLEIDIAAVQTYCFKNHGLNIRIESSGKDIWGQTFLAKCPVPGHHYADDFALMGREVPDIAIIHDRERLLRSIAQHKIGDSKSLGGTNQMRVRYLIQRLSGHMQNCAHHKDVFDGLHNHAMALLRSLPARNRKGISIPSYEKILTDFYSPKRLSDFGEIHRLTLSHSILHECEFTMMKIERWAKELAHTAPCADLGEFHDIISPPQQSYGFFEPFLWAKFCKANGRSPSTQELANLCSLSSFSAFCDAEQWNQNYGTLIPTDLNTIDRAVTYHTWQMIFFSIVYAYTSKALNVLALIPFGGVILKAIQIARFDLPHLYASASHFHFIGKGTPSTAMGNLMPKDRNYYFKKAAMLSCSTLDIPACLYFLPVDRIFDQLADVIEELAIMRRVSLTTNIVTVENPIDNPWVQAATDAVRLLTTNDIVTISAPCGTGKTRYLPSMLLSNTESNFDRICVVLPRRILCDEYARRNPGVVYKKTGVQDNGKHMCCTNGFLAAASFEHMPSWITPRTLLVFDEAHERSIEWQYYIENRLQGHKAILMTATVLPWMLVFPHVEVPIAPLFEVVNQKPETKDLINEFLRQAKLRDRILVIHPSINSGVKIVSKLRGMGFEITHLSAKTPCIPKTGHVVATAIADASLTLPGCDCVIDSGLSVVNQTGRLETVIYDKQTEIQRRGRTGRTNPGIYISFNIPVHHTYKVCPGLEHLLEQSPLCDTSPVNVKLLQNDADEALRLPFDCYAHLANELTPPQRACVALMQRASILSQRPKEKYNELVNNDEFANRWLKELRITAFPDCHTAYETYCQHKPFYFSNDDLEKSTPLFRLTYSDRILSVTE